MLKAELRKIYLEKQKSFAPGERPAKSQAIANLFFGRFDLSRIRFLHCFLPIEKFNEIDTRLIFERVWRELPQVQTLVPRVDFRANEIENLKFTAATALRPNRWRIEEPSHDETIEAGQIDLILVPLLCFDRRGFRVGYGKGFYDRLLKKCRPDCLKIGLSYFAPVTEIEDAQDFDEKLDFCVTPEEIFTTKTRRTQSNRQ